ncbi:MAG: tRNA-modifying protein YgfZ [Actinomycetota bacterium]|nr:tRNA-modifying protein YgfZ [Actinomycetota bacterium]
MTEPPGRSPPVPETELPASTEFGRDYAAFRHTAGVVELARDYVRVAGPDAATFLQGQLSQDVLALGTGDSAWSLLLAPGGKVVAFLRLTRVTDEDFVLDTDAGWGPTVIERVNRFKLRVKAAVEPMDGWRCLAVRGPDAHQAAPDGTPTDWPGLPGVDLLGPAVELPPGDVARRCSLEAYEVVRIEAGVPVMGRELNESTIPQEAGIVDRSVSFTKGCYTGQELVARIDSRGGNVPRRLRGVVLTGDTPPPLGTALHVDGKEVGVVTSSAFSPGRGAAVALAYVRRAVEPPGDAELTWDGGAVAARIEALPLVS